MSKLSRTLLFVSILFIGFFAQAANVSTPFASCNTSGANCDNTAPLYGGPPYAAPFEASAQQFCEWFSNANRAGTIAQCACGGAICSTVNSCMFLGLAPGYVGSQAPTGRTLLSRTDTITGAVTQATYNSPTCHCPANSGALADGSGCACNTNYIRNGASCVAACSVGQNPFLGVCTPPEARPKNTGTPEQCVGNPCNPATGMKYQREAIFASGALQLVLTYNSYNINVLPLVPYPFGKNWSFNYATRVFVTHQDKAGVLRPDGKMLQFTPPVSGNVYVSEADVPDRLEKLVSGSTVTGWRYTLAKDDSVEQYDASGNLISITDRRGQLTTFAYSTGATPASIAPKAGLLITVTDHFGRTLNFKYDAQFRVKEMTDPSAQVYTFRYDEVSATVLSGQPKTNVLTSVEFPDLHKRIYHYNEQAYTSNVNRPTALTGITDENANRFGIYAYDPTSRVFSTEHAGGANRYTFTYNVAVSTVVTDPLGTIRTYNFSTSHGVSRNTGISGPVCPSCGPAARSHDINGFLASETDWNGVVTTYLRQDPYGRLDLETSRTEASGTPQSRTITTQWHATYRLPTLITEPGRTTSFGYDTGGNLLTKTVTDTATSSSRTWTYTYNSIGQVLTVNGPRTDVSDVTTYTYYPDNDSDLGRRGNVATITNALNQVTQITSYDGNGRPLTIVDPNGLTTTLTYSPRGWLTSRTVGSETTTYTYDNVGQLTRVTLPDSSYLEYVYDAAHRQTEVRDNLGNRIAYTLDAMGNRTQEDVRDPGNNLAQTRSRVYDSLNRLWKNIGGSSPSTQITQYGYDNEGNLTMIDGPLSGTVDMTANVYDALNRLKQVTAPGSTVTQYGYDALDQLTSVTDPRNNATGYTVDALGDLTNQASPDTGATVNTVDAAGNVLTSRDAKNQTTTYQYDALNRVTLATYQNGSQAAYGYDAGVNGKGRLTSIVETASGGGLQTQVLYAYDAHGRVLTETRTIGAQTYVTTYAYTNGRLTSVTYPSGTQMSYGFDSAGRINQVNATTGGVTENLLTGVAYHPFGGAKSWTFANGQAYSRSFDLDGRVSGFTLAGTSQSLAFDPASRITSQSYFPNPALSVTHGWDNLDRLTSTVTPSTNYGFGYDANGNRISKTVGASTWTYAYPATNNKLSSITQGAAVNYTHDANGSITNNGTNTFTYDVRGRLTQATTVLGTATYQVNSLGQRYSKTLQGSTTVYLYDRTGKLIAETSDAGATYTQYVWLNDTPVAVLKPSTPTPARYYIFNDHLDTPRVIADQSQNIRWRWDNDDPFGANIANANPSGLGSFEFNLRFPGQYFDKETNQHYNYYRDYAPDIGRYIESDPIGLRGGLNTYAYVYDNPVQLFDALGLDVRVCFFPRAARGFGHVGIGIAGAPSTYGFYPRNQQAGLGEIVEGTPGTVAEDPRDPNDIEGATCQILPATPNQDDCIEKCIKSRASSPGTYRLLSRQCTSFPRDCLAKCVLPSGDPDTPRPGVWYDSLPGGTQSPYIPTPDVTVPNGFAF